MVRRVDGDRPRRPQGSGARRARKSDARERGSPSKAPRCERARVAGRHRGQPGRAHVGDETCDRAVFGGPLRRARSPVAHRGAAPAPRRERADLLGDSGVSSRRPIRSPTTSSRWVRPCPASASFRRGGGKSCSARLAAVASGRRVWNLLPHEHAAAWRVPDDVAQWSVRFLERGPDGTLTTVSHRNKGLKGSLVRFLLAHPSAEPADLRGWSDQAGVVLSFTDRR